MNVNHRVVALGIFLGVVIVCTSFSFSEAEKINAENLDLLDCKKIMARIAKRTLKAFGKCSKELKANVTGDKDEFQKKLGCAVRCTLQLMDLVNEEGKVTREKIQGFMDQMVPSDAHEFGHELASHCNEEYGTKLDLTEENCESYSAYATCMQETLADFADKTSCHPGPGAG